MKQGWEKRKFENCIGKIPKPQQLKTSDYMLEGKFPIVSQETCMISGYTDTEEYVYHVHKPVVVFGDHTRNIKYIDFDFVVGADGVKILIPTEDFNCKFFYYYLTWYNIPSLGYSRHYKLLKDINIPIPPLPIQEKIVSELDCINGILDKKRQQLKELDALAQSLFYQMFGDPINNEKGWEVKKLGEVGLFKNGLNFSKNEFGYCYKFLGVSDFQNNGTVSSNLLSNIRLAEKVSEDYLLHTGDIVFVRSNCSKELVGRSVIIKADEPTTYSGFCIRFRLTNKDYNSMYLSYLLKVPSIRDFISNSGRGCNISNLNQKILCTLPIITPPLPLQQSFASKIEAIEKQKALIKQSIADIETLLASRMQYWFD